MLTNHKNNMKGFSICRDESRLYKDSRLGNDESVEYIQDNWAPNITVARNCSVSVSAVLMTVR